MVSDRDRSGTEEMTRGLNPCSNGIWSLTGAVIVLIPSYLVLILVLMEYGL